jgi:aspartyl/asparaginyl beta-hydroxylase (cupin superfamily)
MSKYFHEDKIINLKVCQDIIANYELIKKEIISFCDEPDALVNYPNYPIPGYSSIYGKYWKAAPLSIFRDEHVELNGTPELKENLLQLTSIARSKCPTYVKCISELEQEGNLANSFISRLIPGSVINPHYGWTKNWMRVHLGIICDPKCMITVGEETKVWEEGKFLAFYDGGDYPHSVVYKGTKERIVVSMDISCSYIEHYNR